LAVPRPREGDCGGGIFAYALLEPARSVCVSLSAFFIKLYFALLPFDGEIKLLKICNTL